MAPLSARDEVGRSIVALLLKEPFFGHLLAGVVRNITEQTETMAVAVTPSGLELRVNPTFCTRTLRRKDERVAVIKHDGPSSPVQAPVPQ